MPRGKYKMQTHIIDGRKIRNEILEQVKNQVKELNFQPVFCDVLVGTDPVSAQYVRMKGRTAESVGIHFHNAHFDEAITTEELVGEIHKLKDIPNMCGLIVQLPLPKHIDKQKVLDAIDFHIDVDCLSSEASKLFYEGHNDIAFPTALACIRVLESLNLDLKNQSICIIGQGQLVGKPLARLLDLKGLKYKTVSRSTEGKDEIIKNSDVIISATGAGKLIKGDMIKQGAVLVDAGTSESSGGIVGDVDLDSVLGVASYVSPVPGGVGPVTVGILLENVLKVAKKK